MPTGSSALYLHRHPDNPTGAVNLRPGGYFRQDSVMDEPVIDLAEIRERIDDVDRRLISLLAERAALVGEVVRYKRHHHLPVVDRAREDAMLERIGRTASEAGVDARVARQVLRTIIDGFTLLEVEELGPDL